jgi:hypothetical protein
MDHDLERCLGPELARRGEDVFLGVVIEVNSCAMCDSRSSIRATPFSLR